VAAVARAGRDEQLADLARQHVDVRPRETPQVAWGVDPLEYHRLFFAASAPHPGDWGAFREDIRAGGGYLAAVQEVRPPKGAPVPLRQRRVWTDLARIFSTVFNPFLTAFALFVILAHAFGTGTVGFWKLLFASTFFTSIGPMLFIFWLYATGRIADMDMSRREEREAVFTAFVLFYLGGTATLWLLHAPAMITASMAGYAASALVVQLITRYWKISTHALGITAPLIALVYLYGTQPLPFLVLIPIVCWARVYLKAHTVLQVIAGGALGAVTVVLFFHIFHVV
jgi:membrane-associated phospholipid phosphatase